MDMTRQTAARRREGRLAWLVWALGAAAFGYAYVQRIAPSVMVQDLMAEFSVGGAILGHLSALYLYAYAGLQIPIGILIDRYGARLMLSLALTLAGLGSLIFALGETIALAYLGRLLVGIGCGVGFVGTLSMIGRWFPPQRFAFMAGLTMAVAMLCAVVAQAPLAALVVAQGWRATMVFGAGAGFVLAALVAIIVRHSPSSSGDFRDTRQTWRDLGKGLLQILTNAQVWLAGIFAATTSAIMLSFAGLWGPPYLMVRYGMERPEAAFYSSLVFAGLAAGAPLAGWLTDRIGKRKSPMIVAAAIQLAAALYLFLEAPLPGLFLGPLIFVLGLTAGIAATAYVYVREVTRPGVEGAVTGFLNTFTVGSGALFQPLIGILLDYRWDGALEGGVRVYTLATYKFAFLSLIGACIVALLCSLFMRETRAQRLYVAAPA